MGATNPRKGRALSAAAALCVLMVSALLSPAPANATYNWYVKNYTAESLYGEMWAQMGDHISSIVRDKSNPLLPGTEASAAQDINLLYHSYLWGRWCYRGSWFNLPQSNYIGLNNTIEVGLVSQNGPVLWAHISVRGEPVKKVDLVKTDAC